MAEVTIRTNNQPRDTLTWCDLTAKEQKDFEYLDTENKQAEVTFVRYRGWTYDLNEFLVTDGFGEASPLAKWHGYHADSYSSGVLVRYIDQDLDEVIMGTYAS